MTWCVITSPDFFCGEAGFISRLLAHGVDVVHLRKPGASETECRRLLDALPAEDRKHIMIHDFFELAAPYGLRGIHLNSRRSETPPGYTGHVSRSCHSIDEVVRYKAQCDYVFLSPIFDSISKQGYSAAFSCSALLEWSSAGIIDSKVFALGGVTPDRIGRLRALGFGGAAMLGSISRLSSLPEPEQIKTLDGIRRAFHPDAFL